MVNAIRSNTALWLLCARIRTCILRRRAAASRRKCAADVSKELSEVERVGIGSGVLPLRRLIVSGGYQMWGTSLARSTQYAT